MNGNFKDEVLMAEELGRLKAEANKDHNEIQNQKQIIYDLEQDLKRAKASVCIKNSWGIFGIFCCIILVVFSIGYPVTMSLITPNVPSHCQIIQKETNCKNGYIIEEYTQDSFRLKEHSSVCSDRFLVKGVVEWGSDIEFGEFKTQEEAINHAKKHNCKIGY